MNKHHEPVGRKLPTPLLTVISLMSIGLVLPSIILDSFDKIHIEATTLTGIVQAGIVTLIAALTLLRKL